MKRKYHQQMQYEKQYEPPFYEKEISSTNAIWKTIWATFYRGNIINKYNMTNNMGHLFIEKYHQQIQYDKAKYDNCSCYHRHNHHREKYKPEYNNCGHSSGCVQNLVQPSPSDSKHFFGWLTFSKWFFGWLVGRGVRIWVYESTEDFSWVVSSLLSQFLIPLRCLSKGARLISMSELLLQLSFLSTAQMSHLATCGSAVSSLRWALMLIVSCEM